MGKNKKNDADEKRLPSLVKNGLKNAFAFTGAAVGLYTLKQTVIDGKEIKADFSDGISIRFEDKNSDNGVMMDGAGNVAGDGTPNVSAGTDIERLEQNQKIRDVFEFNVQNPDSSPHGDIESVGSELDM